MNNQESKQSLPSAYALFRPSFNAVMVNIWTFLCLMLIPIVIVIVTGFFSGDGVFANDSLSKLLVPFLIPGFILAIITAPALPYVQLASVRGKEITLGEALRAGLKKFWRFYGVSLLTALIVSVGILLFIIPGLFMLRRYLLAPYYLYDHDLKIMEAMRRSAEDSKQFSGSIWGIIGIQFLIGVIGVFPILALVSAILTVVYYCAPTVRYVQIQGATKHKKA